MQRGLLYFITINIRVGTKICICKLFFFRYSYLLFESWNWRIDRGENLHIHAWSDSGFKKKLWWEKVGERQRDKEKRGVKGLKKDCKVYGKHTVINSLCFLSYSATLVQCPCFYSSFFSTNFSAEKQWKTIYFQKLNREIA